MTSTNQPVPVVSIIMPMRNAESYIAPAIESILSQSYPHIELIVVDDQSTDQSRARVENYLRNDQRIKLITGKGQGIAAAKNAGLKQASGDYVMFCDADDLFAESCIDKQLNYLHGHPELGALCAQFALMAPDGGNIVPINTDMAACDITDELLSGNIRTHTHLCTYFIKREHIEKMGGFREFFISAEDVDFQFRLAEVCKIRFMPYVTYYYRLHDSSITHTLPSSQKLFFDKTARVLREQRATNGIDDLQRGQPPTIPEGIGTPPDPKTQLQNALLSTAWNLHGRKMKLDAFSNGFRACLTKPTNLSAWKSLIMLVIK